MGPENGRRFFTVDKYHGNPNLGIWEDARCDSVQGASEGVTYHQFVSKNDTLKYLRKTMCRVTPLRYKSAYNNYVILLLWVSHVLSNNQFIIFSFSDELTKSGMTMYKFVLPHNVYAHPQTDPSLEDCFHNPKSTPLLSGLSDVSPCYYSMWLQYRLRSAQILKFNNQYIPARIVFIKWLYSDRPRGGNGVNTPLRYVWIDTTLMNKIKFSIRYILITLRWIDSETVTAIIK